MLAVRHVGSVSCDGSRHHWRTLFWRVVGPAEAVRHRATSFRRSGGFSPVRRWSCHLSRLFNVERDGRAFSYWSIPKIVSSLPVRRADATGPLSPLAPDATATVALHLRLLRNKAGGADTKG